VDAVAGQGTRYDLVDKNPHSAKVRVGSVGATLWPFTSLSTIAIRIASTTLPVVGLDRHAVRGQEAG